MTALCSAIVADADDTDRSGPQPHERRHQDHAPADHPDDTREHVIREVEIERPRDAKHRQLEQHQPDTADEQEAGQIGVFAAVKEGARAGEEDERRSHEVCHPARKENPRRGTAGRDARVDADVVDRHENHDRTRESGRLRRRGTSRRGACSSLLDIHLIERRAQPARQLDGISLSPEVHEEEPRTFIQHVAVQRGHGDSVGAEDAQNRIHLRWRSARNHQVAAAVVARIAWKLIAVATPIAAGLQHYPSSRRRHGDAELIDAAVGLACTPSTCAI